MSRYIVQQFSSRVGIFPRDFWRLGYSFTYIQANGGFFSFDRAQVGILDRVLIRNTVNCLLVLGVKKRIFYYIKQRIYYIIICKCFICKLIVRLVAPGLSGEGCSIGSSTLVPHPNTFIYKVLCRPNNAGRCSHVSAASQTTKSR